MKSSNQESLGQMLRATVRVHGQKVAYLVPGAKGFEPTSYAALYATVRDYAAALLELNVKPGDRVAIQSENCPEWAYLDWACQCLGVTLVPIYPTLPADQAQYIVTDSGAKVVIAGNEDQAMKTRGLDGVWSLLLRGSADAMDARAARVSGTLSVESFESKIDSVDPESIATIIYTSGTTGTPKGVMLAQGGITWLLRTIIQSLPINKDDTFLSFLPMSHVFERIPGQMLPVSCGATIAFTKNLMTLAGDMQTVKPTVVLCVPRFLEAMRERIMDAMAKAPPVRRRLFQIALKQGTLRAQGKPAPLYGLMDRLVGQKIRERVGGRLRFFVSGGAALPAHVAEFYMAFGLTICQGYGLTETSAPTHVNHPDRVKYWTVGETIPGVESRLAEDGEILVRAPSVMRGYYNLPEETAKALDSDGWFHTGDIGEWEGGYLKITDRKKDLLVLANGKNVAPQPIENRLKESPLIAEAVLFGDGSEYVVALIVPNFERLRAQLEAEGKSLPHDSGELIKVPEARAAIKAELDKVNKTLADFEKVKKHALIQAAFSVDGGELTPTLKVKRKVIRERFADVLAELRR